MIATRIPSTLCRSVAVAFALVGAACSTPTSTGEPRVTVIKNSEAPPPMNGIPPEKEAEVQLVLQQRDVTTRRCYQDVLNQKNDRNFQGTVRVVISLGTDGHAKDVKATGGSLNDKEVTSCLVAAISTFEFPTLTQGGDVQYEFAFRPAY